MKVKKLAIFSVALGFTFLPQAAHSEENNASSKVLLAQGEDHAKSGRWELARELLLKACSENPSDVLALHDLAVTYAHTDCLDQAADCERKALGIDENYVPAHIELAWVLDKQDDKEAAREHLKRALALDPQNKVALNNLQTLLNRFRKPGAAGTAQQAEAAGLGERHQAQVNSTDTPVSKALINRGANMYKQGRLDLAKRLYEQALENCPDSLVARSSLGVVRGSSGDFDGEIKDERLALNLQPKNDAAMCNLAWALAQKGELKEALLTYQKALDANPRSIEAQAGQGVLLYRSDKHEAALAVLKESVRVNPNEAQLRLALAAVLQGVERNDEALVEYEQAVHISPNNQDLKARMAAAYLSVGKTEKSADLYRQLLERSPANADFHIGLGLALTKKNDIVGAYQQFRKAADLDKNSAAAHACLSMIEELKGRLSQAESEAKLAQQKDPQSLFFKESLERLAKSKKGASM